MFRIGLWWKSLFGEERLNKGELIEFLAKRTGFSKTVCERVLSETKSLIVEVCLKGGQVSVRNFGRFVLKEKPSRRYVDPQTQRYCICQAKKVIDFKTFDRFRYAVGK